MRRPDTPSALVFELLKKEIAPSQEEMNALRGVRRVEMLDRGVSVEVTGVQGRTISFIPRASLKWNNPLTEKAESQVEPIQIDYPINGKALVRTSDPVRIGIMSRTDGSPGVSFYKKDPDLDEILEAGLKEFPRISSAADIRALNDWVHSNVQVGRGELPESYADRLPAGKYIKDFGAVCRYLVGVEHSLLNLRGVRSEPVSVDVYRPSGANLELEQFGLVALSFPHMHLEVPNPASRAGTLLSVDPSLGICEAERSFSRTLKKLDYEYRYPNKYGFKGMWY